MKKKQEILINILKLEEVTLQNVLKYFKVPSTSLCKQLLCVLSFCAFYHRIARTNLDDKKWTFLQ